MYLRRTENVRLRVTQLIHSHIIQIVYASAAGINTPICSLLVRPIELGYIAGFLILYHSQSLSAFPLRGIHGVAVCAGPRVQESQVTTLATTTAICC